MQIDHVSPPQSAIRFTREVALDLILEVRASDSWVRVLLSDVGVGSKVNAKQTAVHKMFSRLDFKIETLTDGEYLYIRRRRPVPSSVSTVMLADKWDKFKTPTP
jgi:hypothetical protein